MWKGVARCRRLVVSDRLARDSQIVHRLQAHDIKRGEENAKYSSAEKASEYRGNLINIERRITPYRKVNEETEFKKLWQLQNLAILKNFNLKVPKDQQKVVRVAVIGRANSGKSTLINRLIGRNACPVANQNDSTYRTSIHSVQKENIIYEFVDLPGVPDVISPTGVGEYTFRRRNKEAAANNESGNRSLFQRDNANFATNDIFVKNCDVILVCADLTSRMTLAGNLTVMVYKLLKRNPHIPAMLVLTKSDRLKYRTNYKFRNMERKNARLLKLVDIVDKVTEGHLNGQLTESGRHKFFNKPENVIQMKPTTVEIEESGLEQRRPMRFRRMSQVRQVESILRLANSWRWDDLNLHEKRLYQLGNRGWRYFESVFPVTMEMPQTTDVIFEKLAEKALPREWDVNEILDGQLDPFELIEENVSMACLGMTKQGKHKFAAVTDINHVEVNGSPSEAEIRLDLDLSLKTDAERLHLKKNLRSTGKDMLYMEKTYSKYMIRIRNTLENKLKAAFAVKNVDVNLNFLTKELKNEPIVNIAPKMERIPEEIPNYSERVPAPSPQASFDTFFVDSDDFHFMNDNVKRTYLKGLSVQQKKAAGIFEAEEMEKAKKIKEKHARKYGRDDSHDRFDNRPKIFFEMSWFGLGAGQTQDEPDGAEIVKKLSARVASATLLDDRRDSIRALKSMSKKFRREVTEFGLASILELIREENDSECRSLALDAILILIGADDEEDIPCPIARDTALHISQSKDLISLFFNVIDDGETKAKLSGLRLLTALARNYPVEVQNVIQERPGGSSMLVDGIGSANELLRNECLLLLIAVAENNQILQKIIAFENTFEIALNVAGAEGGIDGGPVSEDCFALLLTLLKDNQSNVTFFRETALIPRLIPFLDAVSSGDENWTAGKINCCLLFLGIIRSLVSTTLPGNISLPNQKSIRKTGLFAKLMNFIMGVSVPEEVLTEVILTVSECARRYNEAQTDLAALVAPPPKNLPALVVLLKSMVNSKQPLSLRLAVLYCTCSLLIKNPQCQKATIDSLLPSENPSSFTAGVIISGGLFKPDPLTCWLSAAAMAEAVFDCPEQQAALSRVQLSSQAGTASLSSFLTGSLAHSQSPHARLGILQLIAVWCAGCQEAAKRFIDEGNLVSTLQLMLDGSPSDSIMLLIQGVAALVMGLLAINDDSDQVVTSLRKRPGPDQFLDALAGVAKSPSYASAAGNACPSASDPEELLIFNSFTRIYRQYEAKVGRYVANFEEVQAEMAVKHANEEKIKVLESQLAELQQNSAAFQNAEAMLKQMSAENEQLKQDLANRPKIDLPEGLSEDEIRQRLSEELRPEVESEVRASLAEELSTGVKDELRETLASEIRKELEETVLEALEEELRAKVELELAGPEAAQKDARLAELEQDLNESTEQSSSLLEQLNEMTAQFTSQKKELDELAAKHSALEKSTSNVAQHHENQLLQLQKLLQTATTEIQARDAKIQELISSPNAGNSQEIARLNQEMVKLENTAKIAIGDKQAMINRLEAKISQLESAIPMTPVLPEGHDSPQDSSQLDQLKKTIEELEAKAEERQLHIEKVESENQQLSGQNSESFEKISSIESLMSERENTAQMEIESKNKEIERLSSLVSALESTAAEKLEPEVGDNGEMELLLEKLALLETTSKQELAEKTAQIDAAENDRKVQVSQLQELLEKSEVERENLESRFTELEKDHSKLGELTSENSKLKLELENSKKEIEALKSQPQKSEGVSSSETEAELEELKKDQEDLLELLSDQQLKISDYRSRLKEANQPVTDDEDIELE